MALDFEKLKNATLYNLAALALCEFSRFVDAIERMAPTEQDVIDAKAPVVNVPPVPTTCPHPVELRSNAASMGEDPMSRFVCGICKELVTPEPVGA